MGEPAEQNILICADSLSVCQDVGAVEQVISLLSIKITSIDKDICDGVGVAGQPVDFYTNLSTDAAAVFKVNVSEMRNILGVIALHHGIMVIHEIVDIVHCEPYGTSFQIIHFQITEANIFHHTAPADGTFEADAGVGVDGDTVFNQHISDTAGHFASDDEAAGT